ncbi:MAG: M55 family metallopeptidase [Candidatus Hydrogenedentes bacterium]|nr:M55 family metallopeptidase [Candidatus Hydrogenedentota bacterium]
MNVYICTDLEGVCGVFRWEQTREYGTPANVEARRLLMGEVNAAVAGAFDAGAARVVVRDGHNGAKSFLPEELDERAEMIMGLTSRYDDVTKEGFDAAILLGYHAMSHTQGGVLCHTQSSVGWNNYWINDRLAGEIAQSAIMLGAQGIPVVMVTGDDKTCAEARDWLGDGVVTVEVKKGLSREGALMLAPKKARALIREGAREAVANAPVAAPFRPEFPLRIRWQYKDSLVVDRYRGEAEVIDPYTIERLVADPADILAP